VDPGRARRGARGGAAPARRRAGGGGADLGRARQAAAHHGGAPDVGAAGRGAGASQLAAFGIAIAGETAAQSAGALQRLDYERLLAQAEQARQAAEGRLAQLQQAQDEDDRARSPRRGKW
jgi:hypothetical protein